MDSQKTWEDLKTTLHLPSKIMEICSARQEVTINHLREGLFCLLRWPSDTLVQKQKSQPEGCNSVLSTLVKNVTVCLRAVRAGHTSCRSMRNPIFPCQLLVSNFLQHRYRLCLQLCNQCFRDTLHHTLLLCLERYSLSWAKLKMQEA